MKVQVTEDDIRNGVKSNIDRCPIARAIRRATGQGWIVGSICATIADSAGQRYIILPTCAKRFVFAFDNGMDVEPLDFEFDPLQATGKMWFDGVEIEEGEAECTTVN